MDGVRLEKLTPHDRLRLFWFIGEGLETDLFNGLRPLMAATISGSKIRDLKPENNGAQFRAVEINAADGENLGWLNMLYFKKPTPCYYLVYLETVSVFRQNGLGGRILSHFGDFLTKKSALGILDNIIPKDDPACDIYLKQGWEPIENVLGNFSPESNGYMIFVPPKLRSRDLRQPVVRLLNYLRRKRAVIDMKANQQMVKQTIKEMKKILSALTSYFQEDLVNGKNSALMRFMFTRFATKLIAFRRGISGLIGYTGGESLEQIVLPLEVANLLAKSYLPAELVKDDAEYIGDLELLEQLPEDLKNQPARFIESLPNYPRPSFMSWLSERGKANGDALNLGDLMDLGFDPTRLKEIVINDEVFIIERIQAGRVAEIMEKKAALREIAQKLSGVKLGGTEFKVNSPLLIIKDRDNAYVLRRKIRGIHCSEAQEQLKIIPQLKSLNISAKLGRLIKNAKETIFNKSPDVNINFTYFVSWRIKTNQPELVIDFANVYFRTIWLA